MAAQKKKRKSGLRNVFRKMFGRKTPEKAEDHTEHRPEDTMTRGHSYHRSEPELRRASPPREPPRTPTGPRISDLPVKELEPLHPLGQHLPYPMNVNAPPASPPKEYLVLDTSRPDFGRRRATLATLPSAATQRHSLDEPRIKMATWEEGHEEDAVSSSGIGIALSSPTQPTPNTTNVDQEVQTLCITFSRSVLQAIGAEVQRSSTGGKVTCQVASTADRTRPEQ
ncbi:hypothetical protein Ptr902_14165 [Pyrenophora tritici-repentis]|nr:hypothetical protein Ptr902_14165 [Pyrenophora tritici-repentis]